MSEAKEKAGAPTQPAQSNPTDTVPKKPRSVKKKNSRGNKILTMESSVKTLAIKCYEEQMPEGWEAVKARIVSIGKDKIQIIAICHDSDPATDDIWEPSMEKPHYHINIRLLNGKNLKIRTLLNMLGIVFRKGIDDILWTEGGIETIRDYARYAVYLTHETEEAMLDGKTQYDMDKLVSNLDMDEIKQVRDGYIRVSTTQKVGLKEMSELDELARKIGYELKDFNEWYFTHPLAIRKQSTMRQVKESYYYGVEQRIAEISTITRCCIFIQGKGNIGKTFASKRALAPFRTFYVDGGGTGKFDNLLPSHEAMVIDDYTCSNLLNLSDNKPVKAYKRQNNNPYWCGKYLVVTSNLPFSEWVAECGFKTERWNGHKHLPNEAFDALKTRWFICSVKEIDGVRRLVCDSPATRGMNSEQEERKRLYVDFRDRFNETISQYVPEEKTVTYDDLNDYGKNPAEGFETVEDLEEFPFA